MAEDKIYVVEHRFAGLYTVVNSYIAEGEDLTLIDTGLNAGSAKRIVKKLESLKHTLGEVDLCIITHAHRDHIGGLKELKEAKPLFLIAAYDAEADEIEKSTGLEVDLRLIDGQTVGGFRVIYVPGHTLGSIALLRDGTLITGDAINGGGSELKGPNRMFSKDMALAQASLRTLADLDFERVLVGHGKGIETGGREVLSRLLATMPE